MDKPLKVTIIENGKVIYDELTDEEKTMMINGLIVGQLKAAGYRIKE
ncbi:MAG: hypothetical protein ACOX6M_12710 [Armatimonadota bacterium]|jgi:hypothetical protein